MSEIKGDAMTSVAGTSCTKKHGRLNPINPNHSSSPFLLGGGNP